MTFGDDKKDKVLGTSIIKVNDHFTLNEVALVDKLRYNLLSISQLADADLDLLVCDISRIGKIFQADFSFAQSFVKCFISQSSSKL
jgi:hypothetical protein